MKLPSMKYADGIVKSKQIKFGGLNHSKGAGDGEIFDMRNLTSDHSPVLATRSPRMKYEKLQNPGGLFSWEGLCWVDGTDFYYQGEVKGQVSAGEKSFAAIGAYIVIFPDKCYFNTDTGDFGSMESVWKGAELTFSDGKLYGAAAEANCIRSPGVNWSDYFRAGDGVTISGCKDHPDNNKSLIIREIDGDKLYFYENSFSLDAGGASFSESGDLQIARRVPDLIAVCENENRLWGCTRTKIRASKQGDIFNWEVYDGIASDAYDTDTVSEGAFTGCVAYGGYPIFFKEDNIYKVYGSEPSNFEIMGSSTLGLAQGCEHSLAVAGEILFYLGRNGVTAYTGGVPQPMGAPFGMKRFKNAVAGSDGLKYYISMQDETGTWGLYVYDTQRGIWHKEDETHVTHFARHDGNLYMLTAEGDILIAGPAQDPPEEAEEEAPFAWFAEFADFTQEDPNKKGVGKLQLRLELDAGATVQAELMFDSDGKWIRAGHIISEGRKRSYYLPIVPRRADHYRLRLSGTGGCRIFSLVREYYSGSELRSTSGRN